MRGGRIFYALTFGCMLNASISYAHQVDAADVPMQAHHDDMLEELVDGVLKIDLIGTKCIESGPKYYTSPADVKSIDEFSACIIALQANKKARRKAPDDEIKFRRSIAIEYIRSFSSDNIHRLLTNRYGANSLNDYDVARACGSRHSLLAMQLIIQRSRQYGQDPGVEVGRLFYRSATYTCDATVYREYYAQRVCRQNFDGLISPSDDQKYREASIVIAERFICRSLL